MALHGISTVRKVGPGDFWGQGNKRTTFQRVRWGDIKHFKAMTLLIWKKWECLHSQNIAYLRRNIETCWHATKFPLRSNFHYLDIPRIQLNATSTKQCTSHAFSPSRIVGKQLTVVFSWKCANIWFLLLLISNSRTYDRCEIVFTLTYCNVTTNTAAVTLQVMILK